MKRVLALVDGLNLHHSLMTLDEDKVELNVAALSQFLAVGDEKIKIETRYFTSKVNHLGASIRDKQDAYLSKLKESGAILHFGEFKSVRLRCSICGQNYWINKEKQTDVALASELVMRACTEPLDEIFLFTADTDFLPALNIVRRMKPQIEIRIITTVSSLRPIHGSLARLGVRSIRLSPELVSKFQFPLSD